MGRRKATLSSLVETLALAMPLLASKCGFAQQPFGELQISQPPGRVLTTLKVPGIDPVFVVFDTGTSGNIIDRKIAAKFGLPILGPSTAIDGSLGRPVAGFLTEMKGASLGNIAIDSGQLNAIDYDLPNEKGIFGPNSFRERLVQMDLAQGSICVKPKTAATLPAGPGIPYIGRGDDALPSVTLDFGYMQIAAELDTGNNEALLLPLSLTNRLSLENPPKKVGEAASAAGRQPLFRARLKGALRIGPLKLNRPSILFIEGGQPNAGLPVARRLVILFDPSGRRSWLISARPSPILNKRVVAVVAILASTCGAIAAVIFVRRRLTNHVAPRDFRSRQLLRRSS